MIYGRHELREISRAPSYWISRCGRIWRLKTYKSGQRKVFEIKHHPHRGYRKVYLQVSYTESGRIQPFVHRLVARAFPEIVNPKGRSLDTHDVDHINGIRSDNRAENLQVITHAENCRLAAERRSIKAAAIIRRIKEASGK